MKKKTQKILAAVAAFVILGGLGWFANALVGNPVSKMLAARAAEKHLEETYAGTDYDIERISYGALEIYPEEALHDPTVNDVPAYAINQSTLILDEIYDIRELGRQAGHLVIYVESDAVSVEKAAEIMLDIRAIFDDAGVPFAAIDFTLLYPRSEDETRPDGEVSVNGFLYDEIYEDGMIERVAEADRALKAYYAEQDAKKK